MPYTFHSDPGHGWLEVPKADVAALGVLAAISGYSYVSKDGRTLYLEEDCDLTAFADAYVAKHGKPFIDWRSVYYDNDAPCRSLRHWTTQRRGFGQRASLDGEA